MTGLTLPGMIDEPACRGGRRISPKPACGPDESSRRSLAIFSRLPASVRRMPLTSTKTSAFCVASTRFSARASPRPVICRRCSTDAEDVLPRRAQAGADGRAAEVHHPEPLLALVDPPAVAGEGLGVGRHLAAERHEHGVLQFGAADLHHVGELLFLLLERLQQRDDLALQLPQARRWRPPCRAVG